MKQIESTAIYTDHGKLGYVDLKCVLLSEKFCHIFNFIVYHRLSF